ARRPGWRAITLFIRRRRCIAPRHGWPRAVGATMRARLGSTGSGGGASAVTQDIAAARAFTAGAFRPRATQSLGAMVVAAHAMGCFRLDLAHGLLERQALAGDLGLRQWRLHPAQ